MIPPAWKIEGVFAGVDPIIVLLGVGATAAVIVLTAIVARQVAVLQPKAPPPTKVQKASGEFDAWTERPKSQQAKDQEYYSLYGSAPGRPATEVRATLPAPPPPTSGAALGSLMADLSGGAPPLEEGWATVADNPPSGVTPSPPLPPRLHPPARLSQSGPSDEVVAPVHSSRRVRDTSTGDFPPLRDSGPRFDRESVAPGAVSPARRAGDEVFSPKAPPPPAPPPPPPPDSMVTAKIAESLPEGTPIRSPAKAAFRGPSRGQAVVGAGTTGVQEGALISPEKKAIRCPKCQTVFSGPVTRPATVKCPACGTSGTLR